MKHEEESDEDIDYQRNYSDDESDFSDNEREQIFEENESADQNPFKVDNTQIKHINSVIDDVKLYLFPALKK